MESVQVFLMRDGEYALWTNDERTILVRLWKTGEMEVSLRGDAGETWGPPIPMAAER